MAKSKKKSAPVKKSPVKKMVKAISVKAKPVLKAKMKAKPAGKNPVALKTKPKAAGKPAVAKKIPPAKVAKKVTVSKPTQAVPSKSMTSHSMPKKDGKSENFYKSFLKPLDDRMVVVVGEGEKMTPGGLYIPDTVTDVSGNFKGKVMAIGRGHMNKKGKVKPLDVSVGDHVVFSQFSGSKVDIEGGKVMVIRESDVLGILK